MSLASIGEAAAATTPSDYKALVCVFLYGGNDYANTVVPYDLASYNAQYAVRGNLRIDRDTLTPNLLTPTAPLANGRQYALAPGLDPLVPLFNAGQMAVLLNVGTLVQPTSLAQYQARSVPLPPKLFSHNDQQSYWQASSPEGATSGWGGRMGDLFAAGNANATFTSIGVSGNAVYLAGKSAVEYQITTQGAVPVNGIRAPLFGSAAASSVLQTLLSPPRSHHIENEYVRVCKRSLDANAQLGSALSSVSLSTAFPTGNSLADQLKMVARLIAARGALGAKRQVFFVSIGGFDTHDSLLKVHPGLMASVGNAMAAFYQATVELRAHAREQQRRLGPRLGQHARRAGRRRQGRGLLWPRAGHRQRRPRRRGPGAAAARPVRGPVRRHARELVRGLGDGPGQRAAQPRQLHPAEPGFPVNPAKAAPAGP